jgi:hypothetical protein
MGRIVHGKSPFPVPPVWISSYEKHPGEFEDEGSKLLTDR